MSINQFCSQIRTPVALSR